MTNKISISTICKQLNLAIFFVLSIINTPVYGQPSVDTIRENKNYRFVSNELVSISINKKTKNYILLMDQASVQALNKNKLEFRFSGKKGKHFFTFNLSDNYKLSLVSYQFHPYKQYSSNCSLVHEKSNVVSLKEYSNLTKTIEELATSEMLFDKESCSKLTEDYQPTRSQKIAVLDQFTYGNSELMKCVDDNLVQNYVKSTELEKIFDQMHSNFNQILSGIKSNPEKLKISCSQDANEKANVKLSQDLSKISLNFKAVKSPSDIVNTLSHELKHIAIANTSFNEADHTQILERIECVCDEYRNSNFAGCPAIKTAYKDDSKGTRLNQDNMNINDSTVQEIQNSPAVKNFQPAPDSAVANLANETLRTPAATAVAQGYNGPILQQPSFDNAARAVVNSFTPLVNTLAASITRLEAQTPAGAATTGSSVGSSNEKTSSSKTSSAGAVAPSAVSASATTSVLTNSTGAALATGLQVAAKPIKESASEVATIPSSETATTVNSKMRSGETASTSRGAVAGVSSSSGRGVDAGSAASSAAAGVGQVSLVRQPANEANTFTPARAVITLNTLDTVKGNMYKATKEYYSNDNFKEGLRINGIQIQDGAQVLGATQKPKKIFIDDGQSLTKQKK